jgi:hypothetical protein
MKTSQEIKQISAALVKAQQKIKFALKENTNPHFRSKYADLGSVIDAVKLPLLEQGVTFLQPIGFSETGVSVETVLLHTSGEWISETLTIPVSKQDAQGVGSAITYGRRYGLQAMCGVPAEDDDGNAATASAPRITPVAGSLAALSAAEQEAARTAALEIVEAWTHDKQFQAYELYYMAGHSNELKLGIWECLQPHSKIRNGLKKIHEENKPKEKAANG